VGTLKCRHLCLTTFILTLWLAGCGGGGDSSSASLKDAVCANYQYQQDAQVAFRAGATQLDGDKDGIACESLPGRPAVGNIVALPTFPLDAVYARAMTTGITLNGVAIDGPNTYAMSLIVTPAADAVFESATRKRSFELLTLTLNGSVITSDNVEVFFSTNPFTSLGARYPDGSYAIETAIVGSLPTSATVGSGGALGTLTTYTDATKTIVLSTTQSTWTLEPDSTNTAYGCINSVVRDPVGVQTGIAAGCYRIDTSGNVLGSRYTIAVPGKTLVFQ
jgi:hypothetical protein